MPGCVFDAESVLTGPIEFLYFPLMSKNLSLWGWSHSMQHVEEDRSSILSTGTYPVNRRRRKSTLDGRAGSYKDWFSIVTYVCHQNCQRTPVVRSWAHKTNPDDRECIRKSLQPIRSTQVQTYFSIAALIRCWETMVIRKCPKNKPAKIHLKSSSTSPHRSGQGLPSVATVRTSTKCQQEASARKLRKLQTSPECQQGYPSDEEVSSPRPSISINTTLHSYGNHRFGKERLEFIRFSRRLHFWIACRSETYPAHPICSPPPHGPFTFAKPTADAPTISPATSNINLHQLLGGKAQTARVECSCRSCWLWLAQDEIMEYQKSHKGF